MVCLCVSAVCVDRRVLRAPAAAQDAARFAVDSVLSIDAFGGENVSNQPADHHRHLGRRAPQRPRCRCTSARGFVSRVRTRRRRPCRRLEPRALSGRHPLRTARHGRPGDESGRRVQRVADRAWASSTRGPSLNPVIAPHVSYLSPMPAFDLTVPRVSAISADLSARRAGDGVVGALGCARRPCSTRRRPATTRVGRPDQSASDAGVRRRRRRHAVHRPAPRRLARARATTPRRTK